MRVFGLTIFLLVFGLIFALVVSTAPQNGWFELHNVLIDRTYRFFDALLHVLAVAALLKYLYAQEE